MEGVVMEAVELKPDDVNFLNLAIYCLDPININFDGPVSSEFDELLKRMSTPLVKDVARVIIGLRPEEKYDERGLLMIKSIAIEFLKSTCVARIERVQMANKARIKRILEL